jgi:hypothetical protein
MLPGLLSAICPAGHFSDGVRRLARAIAIQIQIHVHGTWEVRTYEKHLEPRASRDEFNLLGKTPGQDTRLLARVLRELLATETFATLADLTDALKHRCARLRIRWTNDAINEVYRLVGSNRELVR